MAIYYVSLAVLVVLASMRLTRLITADTLGEWLILTPLRRRATIAEHDARVRRIVTVNELAQKAERDTIESLTDQERNVLAIWSESLESDEPVSWQAKLFSGLECPFCIGFWLTAVTTVLTYVLTVQAVPVAGVVWLLLLVSLALSYVVSHVSARLDHADDDDDETERTVEL